MPSTELANLRTTDSTAVAPQISLYSGPELFARLDAWQKLAFATHPAHHLGWLRVLQTGLRHQVYCIEATRAGSVVGLLPLSFVKSMLFGRYLVGLPYVNSGGLLGEDAEASALLVDAAQRLADQLDVRYLELRHEKEVEHPALTAQMTSKVHMRLALPATVDELSASLKSKLRSQIRAGEKHNLAIEWGTHDQLPAFYEVFSRNMRDLGTPVYSQRLFRAILDEFPTGAEICVLRSQNQPVAAALLVHGSTITEVPSASTLRSANPLNANMVMYWHLLCRAVSRGQHVFDFGRSTVDSNTYRFKKQWGAMPEPAIWQYYVRQGSIGAVRPEGGKYDRMIQIWQKLPVPLTRWIGPSIVRGIP